MRIVSCQNPLISLNIRNKETTRHSVPPDGMQGKRHKPPRSALVSVTDKSQDREQPSLDCKSPRDTATK